MKSDIFNELKKSIKSVKYIHNHRKLEVKDGSLNIRISTLKKQTGQSFCCPRKTSKVISFIYKTKKGGLRITKMLGLCTKHYKCLVDSILTIHS